jgi:pimeloyl-ACP methyl ester carboxylesterase
MEKHTVTLPQGVVHYWEYHSEKTPTILMIHGYRGTHHGLEQVIKELPQYRVVVPDLPAFGDSPPMKNHEHTVENYSEMLREFIVRTGLTKPYILGHSMGTVIAADMIAADPDITEKLVLINPVSERPTKGLGALKLAPGIFYHHVAGRWLPEKIGMKILRSKTMFLIGSASMTKTRDKELRKWIHWNHTTYMKRFSDRKTLLEAYYSSSTTTVKDYKDKLKLPVLMIAGKKDDIAPIMTQRRLAEDMENALLVELDNVGHIIHYEKPVEAAKAINDFLKSPATPSELK